MFCEKCGNQLAPGSVFCEKCGTPLENKNSNSGNFVSSAAASVSTTGSSLETANKSVFYYGSLITSAIMIIFPLIQKWIDIAGMISFSLFGLSDIFGVLGTAMNMSGGMGSMSMSGMSEMMAVKSQISGYSTGIWVLSVIVMISIILHVWSFANIYGKNKATKASLFASVLYIIAAIATWMGLLISKVPMSDISLSTGISLSAMVWIGVVLSAANIICTYMNNKEV